MSRNSALYGCTIKNKVCYYSGNYASTDSPRLSSSCFKFKQFRINQDLCAMKVNTDGILLGAWAPVEHRQNLLDIGTGTGLIALMAAQRTTNTEATVTALDIDPDAAKQAKANFEQSPWTKRLSVFCQDVQTYLPATQLFDLILCNPPYFNDSLKAPDPKRRLARHTDSLSFHSLLEHASRLTTQSADFCLILPVNEGNRFIEHSQSTPWQLSALCKIRHNGSKPAFRYLMRFSKQTGVTEPAESELLIRTSDNHYSDEFTNLCRDFYLKM